MWHFVSLVGAGYEASGSQARLNFRGVDDETAAFSRHNAFSDECLEAFARFWPRAIRQIRDVLTTQAQIYDYPAVVSYTELVA